MADSGAKKKGKKAAATSALDMPDVPRGLPPKVELARTRVIAGADMNYNVEENYSANAYAASGVDNSFSIEDFKRDFSIEVTEIDAEKIKFEMKGISPALANAFRRILLAEVPTMAIEKVYIVNNTSIIQDEVLAHRLGLIPIKVDPRLFEFKGEQDSYNETNSIVFRLKIRCTRNRQTKEMQNSSVYSSALEWLPEGSHLPEGEDQRFTTFSADQRELFPGGIAPVHDDILMAKLRPGQEIELEAHAVKGRGKTHAKWSPVGTAWYELVPEIVVLEPVSGAEAEQFIARVHPDDTAEQTCFKVKKGALVVAQSRGCWKCLERVRMLSGESPYEGRVQLRKVKEHYIFTVESVGQLPAEELFTEAVNILQEKCATLLSIM